MNNGLERIWKEMVLASFTVPLGYLLGETDRNLKKG
jgi:hypothetical protein